MLKSRNERIVIVALLCLLGHAAPSRADLSPESYRQMQAEADEAVQIKVLAVHARIRPYELGTAYQLRIRVQVLSVQRSRTGLRPGQEIILEYVHRQPRGFFAGPSEPPILRCGRTYPAYLNAVSEKNVFTVAAGGRSFVHMTRTDDQEIN